MATDDNSDEEEPEFELPLPGPDESSPLRRRLFGGYRPDDVHDAISSRDEAIAVLRRDVAALWLAFGQHERTIRQMLEALETLGAQGIDPPGGRADQAPAPRPDVDRATAAEQQGSPEPPGPAAHAGPESQDPAPDAGETATAADAVDAGALGAQLAGLDEVLAAIEQATQSLEQAYANDIAAAREADPDDRQGDAAVEEPAVTDPGGEEPDED